MNGAPPAPRSLRRALVLLALGTAAWVFPAAAVPAARGGHTTADEPQYLMTAISLGEDGSLDIADERAEGRFVPFHAGGLPRQEAVQDGGRAVSPHDPLLPAFLALPVRVGGWVAAKATLALLAGVLAAALCWVAVRRFAVPLALAAVTVAAFSAAAPLAVYGTQVYPELPAALAVTLAIGAATGPLGRRGVAAVALAVLALPWLSVKYVPVAAALAAVVAARLVRRGDRRAAAGLAAALGAGAAAFAVAHLAWYGGLTPYAAGSHFGAGELTVVGHRPDYLGRSVRLAGLLVDRDFGLAAWQPAFLLAVPAAAALARRRPPGWAALAGPLAAGWLTATFAALTMHGWWFPGRQVVAVLPAAVLAVAWWAARVRLDLRLLAAAGVAGASVFAWLVVQGITGDLTLVVTFESLAHPAWRAWRALLPDERAGRPLDWALHAAWVAALAATAAHAAGVRLRRPAPVASARARPTAAGT